MTDAAAFRACYSDWKLIRTRKCVQLVFEVPLEESNLAYAALGGMPNSGAEVWCAIARLIDGRGTERETGEASRKAPVSRKPVAAEKRLAQIAGILCNDPLFQKFLCEKYDLETCNTEGAADMVRQLCQVTSRSEIIQGTQAGLRFDLLQSAFVGWRDADVYLEHA